MNNKFYFMLTRFVTININNDKMFKHFKFNTKINYN